MDELLPGTSCVIYRDPYTLYRGEIVSSDSDGFTEVFLVDFGETNYYHPEDIYHPYRGLITSIPALYIECNLYGMEGIEDIPGSVEAMTGVCGNTVLAFVLSSGSMNRHPRIRLQTVELVDVGSIVMNIINDELPYDIGLDDEEFMESEGEGEA